MKKIYIIGAGINGMSCAVQIAEAFKGQDVQITVIAEKMTPNTTSDLVAGLWMPYLSGQTPEDKIIQWSKGAYDYFHYLWLNGLADESGIVMIPVYRLSTEDATQNPCWKNVTFGFYELNEQQVEKISKEHGRKYLSGAQFVSFCCEPAKFIPFLTKRFVSLGGKMESKRVNNFDEFSDADLIINCTGLGGRELGDEKLHPIRGQVSRVIAPWMYSVIIDESDDGNYIIPNAESVVLGGTHQVNDYNTKPTTSDNDFIMNGCQRLIPSIKHAIEIKTVAGLRPGRSQVRLETEKRGNGKATIIHNVGHGGCGVTLSYGCGAEVLERTLKELKITSKL